MDNQVTPVPGERLSERERHALLIALSMHLTGHERGPGPLWTRLTAAVKVEQVVAADWLTRADPGDQRVYCYQERDAVSRTSMTAVATFLRARKPHETTDVYVFPGPDSWCIAVTHEHVDLLLTPTTAAAHPA